MKKKIVLSKNELKVLLSTNNIKVRPSYHHEDYMYTSFTMPYPLKNKLDRLSKSYGLSRSAVVQMLIDNVEE